MFPVKIDFRWFAIACLALLISGCSSMVGHHKVDDLYDMPLGSEPQRTYRASVDEVKQAALFSMKQTGLENIAERQMGEGVWYVTGEIGYSWRSNGQFVRIAARAEPGSEPAETQVFYDSVKRFEVNVTEDLNVIRDKLLNFMDSFIESR
jgi:hypothetical protein